MSLEEQFERVEKNLDNIEKTLIRIDERLGGEHSNKLDKIESIVNDLRAAVPKKEEILTLDSRKKRFKLKIFSKTSITKRNS